MLVTACGADQGVSSIAAERSSGPVVTVEPVEPPTTTPTTVEPVEPPTTTPATTAPVDTQPPTTVPASDPELLVDIPIGEVVDIDENKTPREYDRFVAVALADIERWWGEQYPAVYGGTFEPLAGGVYAGYPDRIGDIPGCGEQRTTYQDLNLYVAFYCNFTDFMAYDDGDDSLLAPLAAEFGPAVMGIVLAHEYGHAIQSRAGALERFLATIYTEQQADCFAGAWAGQAYRGESPMLRLGDADVRAGLIAMLEVRDPVGTNQFVEGGHGSAFDRIGAFQEGFVNGAGRCTELLDEPLTLMPNEFQLESDFIREGNASYDCSDDPSSDCTPAPEFLAADINHYWKTALGDGFPTLVPDPVGDLSQVTCSDGVRLLVEVVVCASQGTVAYDEPDVVDLYQRFGDFTLGYLYGVAWAERAQQLIGSPLTGEPRALLNDCYTGAWVADITPDPSTLQPRRTGDRDGDGVADVPVTSSPGDLDEAIRMAILLGDTGADADVVGAPFEKIASFRAGVLGGLDACNDRFGL